MTDLESAVNNNPGHAKPANGPPEQDWASAPTRVTAWTSALGHKLVIPPRFR